MDFSSVKRLSQLQERWIANHYAGTVSPSSGGAVTDEGDVANHYTLFECKYSGKPGNDNPGVRLSANLLNKIHDEAREVGKMPAVAIRLYDPDSPMADLDGFVDWIARPVGDDQMMYDHWVSYQDA